MKAVALEAGLGVVSAVGGGGRDHGDHQKRIRKVGEDRAGDRLDGTEGGCVDRGGAIPPGPGLGRDLHPLIRDPGTKLPLEVLGEVPGKQTGVDHGLHLTRDDVVLDAPPQDCDHHGVAGDGIASRIFLESGQHDPAKQTRVSHHQLDGVPLCAADPPQSLADDGVDA